MNTRLGWFLLIAVSSFLVASCHAEEVQVENVKVDVESPVDKPAVDEVVPAEKTVLTNEKEEVAVPDPVAAEDAPKESARSARNYRYYDEDEYDDDDDEFEDEYPGVRRRYYDEYEEDDEDDEFEPPYHGRYDEDDDDDDAEFEDEDEYDYNELGRSVDVPQGKQAGEDANGANAVSLNGVGSRIICTYGNVVVTQATNRKGVVCTPPGGRQQPNQRPVRPNKVRPQNQNNNQNRRRKQQQRRRRQQQQRRRNQNRRQQNNNQFGGRRGNNRRRFNRPSGKTTGEQKNIAPQIIPASNVKVIRL